MSPALQAVKDQVEALKANLARLDDATDDLSCDFKDEIYNLKEQIIDRDETIVTQRRVIAELRNQLKDVQDELYSNSPSIVPENTGLSWLNREEG